MLAIISLVKTITKDEFAVAAMLLARFVPALLFGPVAGVIVDRWNRKRVMVLCDFGRGALIATLPFVQVIPNYIPWARPVILLLVVSAGLEMLTLLWQPAKDASVPHMVGRGQLMHANSLMLLAAYGTFPLSGAALVLLATAAKWLGANVEAFRALEIQQEHLALYFDAFTFSVSAIITATLVIPKRPRSAKPLDLRRVWLEFADGLRFIRGHRMIRPWVLGIGTVFAGVGSFLAVVVFYVDRVLGGGAAGFGFLVTTMGLGLGIGFGLSGAVSRLIPKDVLFSAALFGLGVSLIGFGSVSTLTIAGLIGVILGAFAGFSYPTGLTLVQENVPDELRGRTLASMYSAVRLALVGSLALAPALTKIIGDHRWEVAGQALDLRGSRVVLWMGGSLILFAAGVTSRAVRARRQRLDVPSAGMFFVFEGGEGTGKSTQIQRLAEFLEAKGRIVLITREPGGTRIGSRIRKVLLDPTSHPMSAKTEALLYAADRAQHVEEIIRPALKQGMIVISDRYVDSSLAYQGMGRGLGFEEVFDLHRWATAGLMPDLVFLLDADPEVGLARSGATDRIEREDIDFHQLVRAGYRRLRDRYPERFALIDAGKHPDLVHDEIRQRVLPFLEQAARRAAGSPAPSP